MIVIEGIPNIAWDKFREEDGAPPVIQYWDSDQPPPQIIALLASISHHNPDVRQIVFDESSAEDFIGEHFSDREVAAFRACVLPNSQADYLRYCAGFIFGGLCIDADVRCGGDLTPLFQRPQRGVVFAERQRHPEWIESIFAWPYIVGPNRVIVNGAFAFVRPQDPLLGLAVEIATANIEQRIADGRTGVWLTTGPGVFTSIYLLSCLGSFDAFLRYAAGTVLEPTATLFCDVVGDPVRAGEAFDGLDTMVVEEFDERLLRHVGVPRGPGVRHWSNPDGTIFR